MQLMNSPKGIAGLALLLSYRHGLCASKVHKDQVLVGKEKWQEVASVGRVSENFTQ